MTAVVTDHELIAEAQRGCRRSLQELLQRHLPTVRMFFRYRGVSGGEEDDRAQETFLRVLTSLARYEPRQAVIAWILAIARNLLIDRWRQRERQGHAPPPPVTEPKSVEAIAVDKVALEDLLQGLTPEERLLLDLRVIKNLSAEEVGKLLDISEGNVRIRVFRTLQRLRERVGKEDSHGA